jgi:hypothetical protein
LVSILEKIKIYSKIKIFLVKKIEIENKYIFKTILD